MKMGAVVAVAVMMMMLCESCYSGGQGPEFRKWEVSDGHNRGGNNGVFFRAADSPTDLFGPIQISPAALQHAQPPEPSSPPLYPYFPTNPEPVFTGRCPVNFSAISLTAEKTAADCFGPLAALLGNVICCPQFHSMIRIFQGVYSTISGSLALGKTVAEDCFKDFTSLLVSSGANNTLPVICSINAGNLTGGSCPVKHISDFEKIVNTSKLRDACANIDPLRECCRPACQPVISEAAIRLASSDSSSLSSNNSSSLSSNSIASSLPKPRVVDDCKGVVLAWLAKQMDLDSANNAFRILASCKVNKACPLLFKDISSVTEACSGMTPSNYSCCRSLNNYILTLQKQMLITNKQALNCATLFGSMLEKEGVVKDVYDLCDIELKDFSLQANGQQGCLLRSLPSDVAFDSTSGVSFTCDLSDNVAAPWPSSTALSSLSTCAPAVSLPALPTSETSGCWGCVGGGILSDIVGVLCILVMLRTVNILDLI